MDDVQMSNPAHDLRSLIDSGAVSVAALQKMTAIPPAVIRAYLAEADLDPTRPVPRRSDIPPDQESKLSLVAALLAQGLSIGDDERLKAIFESLTAECGLTPENLARLTATSIKAIHNALDDPRSLPSPTTFRLALKGSYIITMVNQLRTA